MMTQFAQLYPSGLIRYTQSTYLELVTDTEVHRIDFRGKISAYLRRGSRGRVSFHHEHPLLSGVQGPAATLMARATPRYLTDAPALLTAIRQEIRAQAGEWYDFAPPTWAMWWWRLQACNLVPDLTRTGGIILNSAPVGAVRAIADICARHGVETYFKPPAAHSSSIPGTDPYQLLLIGRNYLIAQKFFVSTLC
ncbi:hypothetical protein EJV47_22715 [Hymenobacter gummosus]|uniref:Uncharacterized protein n=1 Tax=Hymenobacter gummosus TaxID=1776032 RepID=A0A3S0HKB1_9BACT|nr:hypothetical protein [Hymenobacter gummosus]RTQ46339.1 hypothetical protein EJV47_22715 [Hymenobacter gummosus]